MVQGDPPKNLYFPKNLAFVLQLVSHFMVQVASWEKSFFNSQKNLAFVSSGIKLQKKPGI